MQGGAALVVDVVLARSNEELSSMHTRMSDLAWARVFRKPFRRPNLFTRRWFAPRLYRALCPPLRRPKGGESALLHPC